MDSSENEEVLASLICFGIPIPNWPNDGARQDAYTWLEENDLPYHDIPVSCPIEVILMDAPFIRYTEFVTVDGQRQLDRVNMDVLTRKCVKPLRTPMPDTINAMSSGNAILKWKEHS